MKKPELNAFATPFTPPTEVAATSSKKTLNAFAKDFIPPEEALRQRSKEPESVATFSSTSTEADDSASSGKDDASSSPREGGSSDSSSECDEQMDQIDDSFFAFLDEDGDCDDNKATAIAPAPSQEKAVDKGEEILQIINGGKSVVGFDNAASEWSATAAPGREIAEQKGTEILKFLNDFSWTRREQ
jgi:hypothetical protein